MPLEIHKTVFISYRRKAASFHARAIFENLKSHGYDVFMDVENIDAGDWKRIIENQIRARAHFLVVLTAGTIGKFDSATDMMRYEIEYAMEHQRNIVPLLLNDFKFSKTVMKYLTGKLADLPKNNGAPIRHDLFDGYMTNLRERFLRKPVDVLVTSFPASDNAAVERNREEIAAQHVPTKADLDAEIYFSMGYESQDQKKFQQAIADYTEAIRFNPLYADAYNNRGIARAEGGDLEGAINDYTKALDLNPQDVNAYHNRGNARYLSGNIRGAIDDYTEVLKLNPQESLAYYNRGNARYDIDNIIAALSDYDEAIRLAPQSAEIYTDRGNARYANDNIIGALADYNETIRLNPDFADAYNNRGEVYFVQEKFDGAQTDFQQAIRLEPERQIIRAGLAIACYELDQTEEATRLWKELLTKDTRYQDADWVGKEFNWRPELVEAARKLIATL